MSDEVPQEQETQVSEEKPADFSPGHESGKKRKIPWKPAAGFAAVAILFFAAGFLVKEPAQTTGMSISGPVMTSQEAGNKAVDYLNKYVGPQSGFTAKLISANESNGIYEVSLNITSSQGSQVYPSYVTKDGKLLFVSAIDISAAPATQQAAQQTPPPAVPKTNKPIVNLFVMSYCPYGLQMEKAMIPVMELLGNKTDIKINFVDYSMHGQKEIDENTRQYCIQKEQPAVFDSYLRCFVQSDDTAKCQTDSGVDKAKLATCVTNADSQFNITGLVNDKSKWNGNYPPFMIDAGLNQQYNVGGSPTLIINGAEASINRSPEAVKEAVCSAFSTPPSECNTTLSATQESPGIGAIGSGTGSAGSSGGCGTTA